ncbi:GTP cyclohydrolase I, partial [Candidatus Pacearchaeota archaeon]|nr:GTP cyclohydrolase I [Candidatus Pacearchaeota archaeon]
KAPRISTLTLDNGVKIRVTDDHPIRVKSGWMECGELQIGDKVEWVNGRTLCKTNYAFNIGEDLGYILGAIASDGSIQDDRRICIEVNDLWFVENIKSAYKKAFDVDVNIEKIIKPSGFLGKDIPQYRIRVVSSQIAKRLLKMLKLPQGLGSKSKTKKFKLPEIVKHDISVCRGFLAGYIDGDGTRNFGVTPDGRKWGVNNSYVIASANKEFLLELAEMLQSNFKWTDRREREGNGGMYISPTWENKHGFKQEDFHLDIGESEWIKVKNIETEEKMTTVYSFKCEEYPTFLVNGILTHNCEHHFVTVCGYAHIAYVPHKKVIGLSKMNRIVDYFGNRPQVQERLNEQIQKYLSHVLETNNVAVVIDAVHFCVRARGIKDSSSVTRTASLGGIFKNTPEARAEFFSTIPKIEDFKL